VARRSGADLVGVAPVARFDHAPAEAHPRSLLAGAQSVVVLACRMLRGSLKTIEDGTYWQAYNCDSYQYINEVVAPHILRALTLMLEDQGFTSVPIHNPFLFHAGRPVRPDAASPDVAINLRLAACAAGLGEIGLSGLLLTPQFGPRQRLMALITDAPLQADPLLEPGAVCDGCGLCRKACPARAIPETHNHEAVIAGRIHPFSQVDRAKCQPTHQGWDKRFSPFLTENTSPQDPPEYYRFLDGRFNQRSICGGRGCIRACVDHLEKTGRIRQAFITPMIDRPPWELDVPAGARKERP
jgi:ferredoxin